MGDKVRTLFYWHETAWILRVRLGHQSCSSERHRGAYKTLSNQVVATDEQGVEIGIVFETTTPFDTPREMEELVRWTSKAIDEASMHPLLIIAVFIVVFLAIHPFQDGNGKLQRHGKGRATWYSLVHRL